MMCIYDEIDTTTTHKHTYTYTHDDIGLNFFVSSKAQSAIDSVFCFPENNITNVGK